MTTPTTGPISMSHVAIEIGQSVVGLSLNLAAVRAMTKRSSGIISLNDLRGAGGSFGATSSTGQCTGTGTSSTPGAYVNVVTNTHTTTPSGGSYVYINGYWVLVPTLSWASISGTPATVSVNSATLVTTFSRYLPSPSTPSGVNIYQGVMRATVTDGGSYRGVTFDVTVQTWHYAPGGGGK